MNPSLRPGFGIGGQTARTLSSPAASNLISGSDLSSLPETALHEYWMERALLEAMESNGLSQPNPAVGCVLVQESRVIARGSTRAWKHEHAERVAFENLDPAADLARTTAYVTLEPCSHQGFQPPCVDLLLRSPIPKIVIAVEDPDPRVKGAGIRRLREAGKDVRVGVLENEARAWNLNFFISKKLGRPAWGAKWAQTPSGNLCDANGHSKWITGKTARAHTHWLRQKYDAIVVGAQTFLMDRPALTVRDCALPHHRNPERFVFDPKGRTLDLPIAERKGFKILVCKSELEARGWRPDLKKTDGIVPVPVQPDDPSLWLAFRIALESTPFEKPLQSIMVEGGPGLLNGLFKHDLFDVVHRFTGKSEFASRSDRYRLDWQPTQGWLGLSQQDFSGDLLHEFEKKV